MCGVAGASPEQVQVGVASLTPENQQKLNEAINVVDSDKETDNTEEGMTMFDRLRQDELPKDLRDALSQRIDDIVHKLRTARETRSIDNLDARQNKAAFQSKEREFRATLEALLQADAVIDAHAAGASHQLSWHDPVTLLKGKPYLGRLLRLLSDKAADGYKIMLASADLDNFGVINNRCASS